MNPIFGASSMFNNQPPAANRQFREDVARLLPCGVHATARKRARPIPFPSRMGPPPHAFRFSAVSPLRGPQRGKQLVRIPRGDAPMRTGIPISSGKAAISFDFSSAFTWPIAIFSRDEYALAMHGCLPSSPCALRRHLPSRWIVSPAGGLGKAHRGTARPRRDERRRELRGGDGRREPRGLHPQDEGCAQGAEGVARLAHVRLKAARQSRHGQAAVRVPRADADLRQKREYRVPGTRIARAERRRGEWKESGAASAAPRPFGIG